MTSSAQEAGLVPSVAIGQGPCVSYNGSVPVDASFAKARRRRLSENPADACARVITGALFLALAWRLGGDFLTTGRVTDLLLLVSEALVVLLTVLRRRASSVDRRTIVRLVTALSMVSPLLVRPGPVGGLVPEAASAAVAAVGLAVVIAGKLSLGYSFGLLPAHRGLVESGLYRVVRHPIYLGYILTHIPFLAAHPTVWNAVVLGAGDVALIVRASYEEQTLTRDPAYGRYRQRLKWRLVPGLY